MKVSGLLLAATIGVLGFSALPAAAAVEFDMSLVVDQFAHTWQAYGQIGGDLSATSGLSAIEFTVAGASGVTVSNSTLDLPIGVCNNATFADSGFWFEASNGTAGAAIQGIQSSPKYYKDPSTGQTNVLLGVGLTAGTQSNATWSYPVLLAHGTYTGSKGTLSISADVADNTPDVVLLPAAASMPTPDATGTVGITTFNANTVVGQTYPILAGDANHDGHVNGIDLGIMAGDFFNTGMTWAQGDFNGDGNVNGIDLGIMAGNFFASVPGFDLAEAGVGATSSVPEPTSLVLLGAGLLGVLGVRRRVRAQ